MADKPNKISYTGDSKLLKAMVAIENYLLEYGGGGGARYVEDVLYSGSTSQATYTLLQSVENYNFLILIAGYNDSSTKEVISEIIPVSELTGYISGGEYICLSDASAYTNIGINSNTELRRGDESTLFLQKVIGVKFAEGNTNLFDGVYHTGYYVQRNGTPFFESADAVFALIPLEINHHYQGIVGGTSVTRRRICTIASDEISTSTTAIRHIGTDTDTPLETETFVFKANANENFLYVYLNYGGGTTGEMVVSVFDVTP